MDEAHGITVVDKQGEFHDLTPLFLGFRLTGSAAVPYTVC
jgi:hypothetical protein